MTARATRYAVGSIAVVALVATERWLMTQDWTDFAKWCASLGVGGVLAAFMFMFYRRDMKDRLANQQQQTDLLTERGEREHVGDYDAHDGNPAARRVAERAVRAAVRTARLAR